MPNLMGKQFSYDKKGMREFQKAKKKMDMMGKKNGGLVKYRDGGVVKNKSDVQTEQDRVTKKFATNVEELRSDEFKTVKMSKDKIKKMAAKALGSKIGSTEKMPKMK